MDIKELLLHLKVNSSQVEYGYAFDDWELLDNAANMISQQADRIAELEKEVLMWENAEVPTEVMADLIQELERRKFITTPQIKELSDEEIQEISHDFGEIAWLGETTYNFARAILKKASEK